MNHEPNSKSSALSSHFYFVLCWGGLAILSNGYTQNCQPQDWLLVANSEVGNLMLSRWGGGGLMVLSMLNPVIIESISDLQCR